MASTVSTDKLKSTIAQKAYDFDPNATTLTDIAWVDLKDFLYFMVCFMRTIGTGAFVMKIAASASSSGSNSVVVKEQAYTAGEPDAVGDNVFLECTAEEIAALGTHLRYVSAQCSVATNTDEGVVVYTRAGGYEKRALTADVIA